MPLTLAELEDLRAECFADDVPIPPHALKWDREQAVEFFENGGTAEPATPAERQHAAQLEQRQQRMLASSSQRADAPAASTPHNNSSVAAARAADAAAGQRPKKPTPAVGWRLAAPMHFKVAHSYVRIRHAPALDGREIGMLRNGTVISTDTLEGPWVQIDGNDPCGHGGGWMLTDGRSLNLGVLLEPDVLELKAGTQWVVTCFPGGGGAGAGSATTELRGFPTLPHANGESGELIRELRIGSRVEVIAECGLWARVALGVGEARRLLWVEMDAFFAG